MMGVVLSIITTNVIMHRDNDFPSFAPSPVSSPDREQVASPPMRKIAIELPESLMESATLTEGALEESQAEQSNIISEEGSNIRIYCRFRPVGRARQTTQSTPALSHDHSMIEEG